MSIEWHIQYSVCSNYPNMLPTIQWTRIKSQLVQPRLIQAQYNRKMDEAIAIIFRCSHRSIATTEFDWCPCTMRIRTPVKSHRRPIALNWINRAQNDGWKLFRTSYLLFGFLFKKIRNAFLFLFYCYWAHDDWCGYALVLMPISANKPTKIKHRRTFYSHT